VKYQIEKLEALRGFGAIYVLLHHVSSSYLGLQTKLIGLPFRFGQEAVLIFFILSGFVIHYASAELKTNQIGSYIFKRVRRIYPIYVLSLVLSYIIFCFYSGCFLHSWFVLKSFLENILMLQTHPGNPECFFEPFCANNSLWSISYEWWFYMIYFPLVHFISPKKQKYVVIALCLFGMAFNSFFANPFTHFLVLFPVWWLGVEMAKEYLETSTITFRRQATYIYLLLTPAFWMLIVNILWYRSGREMFFITYPFLDLRYFISTIGLFIIAMIWKNNNFIGYHSLRTPFVFTGSFSYTLYLIHFPIICFLTLLPGKNLFWDDLLLKIVISFVLSYVIEKFFQEWINKKTRQFLVQKPY